MAQRERLLVGVRRNGKVARLSGAAVVHIPRRIDGQGTSPAFAGSITLTLLRTADEGQIRQLQDTGLAELCLRDERVVRAVRRLLKCVGTGWQPSRGGDAGHPESAVGVQQQASDRFIAGAAEIGGVEKPGTICAELCEKPVEAAAVGCLVRACSDWEIDRLGVAGDVHGAVGVDDDRSALIVRRAAERRWSR